MHAITITPAIRVRRAAALDAAYDRALARIVSIGVEESNYTTPQDEADRAYLDRLHVFADKCMFVCEGHRYEAIFPAGIGEWVCALGLHAE